MSVNAEAVVVLTKTDLSSLARSLGERDPRLIRMVDGSTPTREELELIMSAGEAELNASVDLMRRYVEDAREQADAGVRAYQLVRKYERGPRDTIEDALPRMTSEDREEFLRLVGVIV